MTAWEAQLKNLPSWSDYFLTCSWCVVWLVLGLVICELLCRLFDDIEQ
jgi:hypothetical protein